MTRLKQQYEGNGFFGIGILNNANEFNIGTLWRSAYILGASFIFTVTKRFKPQSSDVTKAWTKIPLYHYKTIDELKSNLPHSTQLIGVEMTKQSTPLIQFKHPIRGVYLLGNEQIGLSDNILNECESVTLPPKTRPFSKRVQLAIDIKKENKNEKQAVQRSINNQNIERKRIWGKG